ncbi:MAG: ribosomal protein S18-alanine N-acetyltransferase [Gemmatimonadaceae bacterium]|nr:ribosomal protein S18-alanine N-acetyltransferase [Gemmatimonadaceae bacterium]
MKTESAGAVVRDAVGTSLVIRPANAADIMAVAAIERLTFSDPWSGREFTAVLALTHAIFLVVADEGGDVAGYAVVSCVADEAEVLNIAVSPTRQRSGLGGRLLDAAMDQAKTRGAGKFFLEVRESNAAARALYASRGFKGISRRNGYYQNPAEDALVLRAEAH